MKINKNTLIKVSLGIGLSLVLLGAFFKISHWKGGDVLMIIGLVATLIYSVIEVSTNYHNQIKIQPIKSSRDTLITVNFAIGFSFLLIASILRISHWQGAQTLLIGGFVATLVYMVIALYEVFKSTRINKPEKIMWTICIILLSPIAGLVYMLSGRKRIIPISE
jgi:hypothetical protein